MIMMGQIVMMIMMGFKQSNDYDVFKQSNDYDDSNSQMIMMGQIVK